MCRFVIFSPEEIEKLRNNKEVPDPTYGTVYMSEERFIQRIFKQEGEQVMTGNEYQKLAARTIDPNLTPAAQERHALYGMCGEIGELQSLYQKEYQGHKFDGLHAKKELGDLLWFVAEYCTAMGWSLEDVMTANIEKLQERYPDGFDNWHSLHRKEGDI